MRIKKLVLQNINSLYGKWEIDFDCENFRQSGIFAVTGKTGSVKFTAEATDGSGIKDTVTVNFKRLPQTLTVKGDAYIVSGKSATYKAYDESGNAIANAADGSGQLPGSIAA